MVLPIFVFAGAALAFLGATSTAGSIVAAAIPVGLWKKNKEHERNMRVGINTEFEKHKQEKTDMRNEDEAFFEKQFEADELPPLMHWLLPQRWLLTETEFRLLMAMINRQMLDIGQGEYAETTKALCVKYGISYEEMAAHSRTLSGKVDFRYLRWVSDNRAADKTFKKKLEENG